MPSLVPSRTASRTRETVLDCTITIVVLSVLILLLASAYPSNVKIEDLGPDTSTIPSFTLSMSASALTSTSKNKESISIAETSTEPSQSSSWASRIPPQLSISASILPPTSTSSQLLTHVPPPPPPPTSTPKPSQTFSRPPPSTSGSIPRWFNLFFYEKPNFEGKETYKIPSIDECMDIGPPLSPGSAKTWDDTTICYLYAFSDCTSDALKPEGRLAVDDKSPAENISKGMYLSAQCFVKA